MFGITGRRDAPRNVVDTCEIEKAVAALIPLEPIPSPILI